MILIYLGTFLYFSNYQEISSRIADSKQQLRKLWVKLKARYICWCFHLQIIWNQLLLKNIVFYSDIETNT